MLLCVIISIGVVLMNLHITKSKNAESFYIAKSYTKANGKTSSVIVRKLGTLNQLIVEHGPTRDDVLAWAKNEVKLETEKYKKDQQTKAVQITFHSDHKLDYGQQVLYRGGAVRPGGHFGHRMPVRTFHQEYRPLNGRATICVPFPDGQIG